MAAPAETDEFKGNVFNVFSEKFWPMEIDAAQEKIADINQEQHKQRQALKKAELSKEEHSKQFEELKAETRAKIEQTLTEDELFTLDVGVSNRGFHYHGSAKFFARLGEAFANALIENK